MAIILTDNAKAKILTPLGTEPLLILKINWDSGVEYYSEKPYTFDGNTCKDVIVSKGSFQSQGKDGSIGEISSLDITFDDTSGDLKTKVNIEIIEGTTAIVYHHYDDLTAADATVILSGKITGPIKWLEGERLLDFSIESYSGTGVGEVGFAPEEDSIENLLDSAAGIPWPIVFGSPRLVPGKLVQQIEPTEEELLDDPDMVSHTLIYIVNLTSSNSVSGIYAKRNCYGADGFYQVPAGYYSVDLAYSYGGKTVTAILMPYPLNVIDDSGWSNEIYISLTSSLSENTATQIKWILDTYSSLSTDATSFSNVANKISNLPSHWALFDQPDSLNLAEEMAWQARCALYIKNNIVYIKYLAEFTGVDTEISKNDVELKTLELDFTRTEDIITKFKAKYVSDYSGEKDSNKEYIYTRNTDKFGVEVEEYNFEIYTNPECVKAVSQFWGYKYSTSWRKIKITTFLTTLASEAYDWININLPIFSTYTLPSRVLVADRDVENHRIEFELEVASSAGRHIGGQPSLDSGYYDSTGQVSSIEIPESSITLFTTCYPVMDSETLNIVDSGTPGGCIKAISVGGVGLRYDVCEIVNMDQDGYIYIDKPSANNLSPDKIVFIKENFINSRGCVYSASGDPQWCDKTSISPDPNWGSAGIKVGDSVGTVKDSTSLSKEMSGFIVVGIDNEIAVSSSQVEPRVKIKSDIRLRAWDPAEIFSTDGENIVVGQPTENSLPPARIIFPDSDIEAGGEGLGWNAFDVSPFVDGESDPDNPNAEMGTVANSFNISYQDDDGNPQTGFIRITGKGGKHQVRPF